MTNYNAQHNYVELVNCSTLFMLPMFIFQSGRTPLLAACEGGDSKTAQLLVEKGADLNEQDVV